MVLIKQPGRQPLKRGLEAEGPRHTQTVFFSILLKATLGGRLTILNKVLFDLGEFPHPPSLNSSAHQRNFAPICCLFSGFIHNLLKILYFSKWPILPNFPHVYEEECIRYQALGSWAICCPTMAFSLTDLSVASPFQQASEGRRTNVIVSTLAIGPAGNISSDLHG